MTLDRISTFVAVIGALSVASERLVEITKGLFPLLGKGGAGRGARALSEPRRRAVLHVLTVVFAVLLARLAGPAIPREVLRSPEDPLAILALGLLAAGGSGVWNSVLSYLEGVKKIRGELEETIVRPPALRGEER